MILYRAPRGGAPGLRERSSDNSGLLSIRFGSEQWWYGSERRASRREREEGEEIDAGRLHVVTQVGDSFERAYPKARVIANHGRHLLVDLPPTVAERIRASDDRCFRVERVSGDVEVFRTAEPSSSRRTGAAQAYVDAVSRTELETIVTTLAAFTTRNSTSATFVKAVEFAEQKLRASGYTPSRTNITVNGKPSLNVITEKRGTAAANRQVVLVTAHLDSINLAGGAAAKAPGADDNASGAAGVLEIARTLAKDPSDHDIRFILFGGEEQGLFGSTQYVASLTPAEKQRIGAVLNMDMIGTRNGTKRGVLIEGGEVSRPVIDALSAAAAAYTTLEVTTSLNPFNSDHVPFIDAGIPAVLTIEAGDSSNANIHGPKDTIDKIDHDLLTAIVRMNTGFIAERAAVRKEETVMPETTTTAATGKLSGRYDFNGGVPMLSGRGFVDRSGNRRAAIANPSHALTQPVFAAERATGTRLTLHIDVDGTDPLNVVSGVVADGGTERHFIGRAQQAVTPTGVRLTVKDFSFKWPGKTNSVTKATIDVTDSTLTGVVATITFTAGTKTFGPFSAKKVSPWFREVEVDVDREVGCADVEPVSTHVHPDRPNDITVEDLTLESAFAKAGIKLTRANDTAVAIDPDSDRRWTDQELHDSMVLHWEAFANRPQWKMWIFLANRHFDDGTGGVMFDGDIDEPGGVDRQGTALFTRCPLFHTPTGDYIVANPPVNEAIKRELFFNLIHETGHAFNLAHSFQKTLEQGSAWNAPTWAPVRSDNQALSWLNYPDRATPSGGAGLNASWFYKRFKFRFDDGELLFLRHAPAADVEMGAQAWFDHHGRVARESVDSRLKLEIRHRNPIAELGEPIIAELKLKNVSGQAVTVHRNLDPSEGFVEFAVTSPSGKRRPYVSVAQARRSLGTEVLQPGKSIYAGIDLTMGIYGFPFKEPGAYRIEASYTNLDGSTAAAVAQLYVRPAPSYDAVPVLNDLYRADVGRVLLYEGTEVMDEVNERLANAETKLAAVLGPRNPVGVHLRTTRLQPLGKKTSIVEADGRTRKTSYDPDRFIEEMATMLIGDIERSADTMGHIWIRDVIDQYTDAALACKKYDKAYQAQNVMHALFERRGVVANVLETIAARAAELKKMASKTVARTRPQLRLR